MNRKFKLAIGFTVLSTSMFAQTGNQSGAQADTTSQKGSSDAATTKPKQHKKTKATNADKVGGEGKDRRPNTNPTQVKKAGDSGALGKDKTPAHSGTTPAEVNKAGDSGALGKDKTPADSSTTNH